MAWNSPRRRPQMRSSQMPTKEFGRTANSFVSDGWKIAEVEGAAAFQTIEIKYEADTQKAESGLTQIRGTGTGLLETREHLDKQLQALGYSLPEHLRSMRVGRLDLGLA